MAKTKSKPGPKPGTITKYPNGKREYHFVLPLPQADRFDEIVKENGGVIEYIKKLVLAQPEMHKKHNHEKENESD